MSDLPGPAAAPAAEPSAGAWNQRDGRALAAVAAQFWINGMVYAAVVPRLPDIRDRLGIGVSTLGLMLTIAAVGGLAGSAAAGRVIARFGTRRSILWATATTLVILPVIGLSRSAVVITLALAAMALLDVWIDIGMNIQGSRLSAKRAKPVMNRLHGLWSLGTVVGGLVAVRAGGAGVPLWLHMVLVSSVLAVTIAVSGPHLLPGETSIDDGGLEPGGGEAGVAGPERGEPGRPLETDRPGRFVSGRLLSRGLLLGLLGGAAVVMELTTSDWAAFRLADDLGVGPGRVGLGFVAFTAGMVTGRFAGDTVQGMVGSATLVRAAATLAALGLGLATLAPAETIASAGPGWLSATSVVVAGFYLAALGVSVIFPQLYDRAAKAPGPPGQGLAALTAGTRMAGLVAPIIVGFLADTSLSVGVAVALVTIPSCVITMLGPTLTGAGRGSVAEAGHRPAG